jgi:Spy/CpxP family protein refolding chaperone
MWKNSTLYLIVVSVALNVAFIAMWVAYAAPVRRGPEAGDSQVAEEPVWCPLHRQLGVSPEQWQEIEPRLRDFQASVAELCQQTDGMRSQVIELLAAEEPDLEAIRARQDEILETKRRIQQRVVDHLLAEKNVLTPEQQRQLFALLRDRTGCGANPPMSGNGSGGLGRALQDRGSE